MISREVIRLLESRYGLAGIASATRLEGGERNFVSRLDTGQGRFVLRISPPDASAASVAYEHALLRHVGGELPEAPCPIAARDGTTLFLHEGRVHTLLPFMPGKMAPRDSVPVRREAARLLARIHRSVLRFPDRSPRPGFSPVRELDWDENPLWSWPAIRAGWFPEGRLARGERAASAEDACRWRKLAASLPRIEAACGAMAYWVQELAASERSLLLAPMHGDYYRRNLLVEGDRITAVLDWDECGPEWLALELGRAIWEFCKCKHRHTLDVADARVFLAAYREAEGPVPESEADLLIPFMRAIRVIEILLDLTHAARGQDWDAEYALHNLHSLANLEQTPPAALLGA
jgi:Ser/Thr protein kinase RdoA (MazF antagonist)